MPADPTPWTIPTDAANDPRVLTSMRDAFSAELGRAIEQQRRAAQSGRDAALDTERLAAIVSVLDDRLADLDGGNDAVD
jgi:hypothetical protein